MAADRKIVLEDGSVFAGTGFGSRIERVCDITFNTAIVGYQEMISNPSCVNQAVVMTYPIIGSYGITDEDFESKSPSVGALIVREYNDSPSNFRYTKTLAEEMEENDIPGIQGIDTRMLTRRIVANGAMKVLITDIDTPEEECMSKIAAWTAPTDAVASVSCKKPWYSRTAHPKYNVVAIDCGIKQSIIRALNKLGCNVTVMPYNADADKVLAVKPDGVVISNGPGSPANVPEAAALVRELKGKLPILGINLGCGIIGAAYGAEIVPMKHGHAGGNHPVRNLKTGKVEISSQGHGYMIDAASIEKTELAVSHINLLDNTVEGVVCEKDGVQGVQYHPESSPGPQDSAYIFHNFIKLMEDAKNA